MYSKYVGNELKAIRNRNNLSLKQLEEKTGICAQNLSEYENNKVQIKISTLEKILSVYNMNLFIFFKQINEYTHIENN